MAVCKQAGIPLRGEKNRDLSESDLRNIAEKASSYRIQAVGTEGFDKAQVMAGGLICRDFDPHTLMSCLQPGLHAAGEVLDVDGDCGGFNLQFAFASGLLAGERAGRESEKRKGHKRHHNVFKKLFKPDHRVHKDRNTPKAKKRGN